MQFFVIDPLVPGGKVIRAPFIPDLTQDEQGAITAPVGRSNVLSAAETALLRWLSLCHYKQTGSWTRVIAFDRDLRDGTVLASVIKLYAGNLVSVPDLRNSNNNIRLSSREQSDAIEAKLLKVLCDLFCHASHEAGAGSCLFRKIRLGNVHGITKLLQSVA
jgi:hypothetical protein